MLSANDKTRRNTDADIGAGHSSCLFTNAFDRPEILLELEKVDSQYGVNLLMMKSDQRCGLVLSTGQRRLYRS